ncbi:MAG: hypothetical protein ACOCWF_09385 [Halochromatium sp.]
MRSNACSLKPCGREIPGDFLQQAGFSEGKKANDVPTIEIEFLAQAQKADPNDAWSPEPAAVEQEGFSMIFTGGDSGS